jgi:2-methylisocitrate lyase-like PEP mutase family enzyme
LAPPRFSRASVPRPWQPRALPPPLWGSRENHFLGELAAAGVRRISLATSLYRAAMTGLLEAASAVKDAGRFDFVDRCVTTPELYKLMEI